MDDKQTKIIPVPQKLLNSLLETKQKWEEFSDELEDFLISSDDNFIDKLRKARKEHLDGKTKLLQELKKELS